jgi:hypothetical protein
MIWNGDWSWIYKKFKYPEHARQYRLEQRYTTAMLTRSRTKVRLVQDYFDGFKSFKNDCRGKNGMPEDAKIVAFHGYPRPHQCKAAWVKKIWNEESIWHHPFEKLVEVSNGK